MKLLITNEHLYRPGGSETAAYTLAVELIRQGHEVSVYTTHKGEVSDRMQAKGAKWIRSGHFDRVICSHWPTQAHLIKRRDAGVISWDRMVRVCHGTIPDLEQPIPGADAYVAISEEVQAHLKGKGYESVVIRNGIDCERFKPIQEPEPNSVLSLCQSQKANDLMRKACDLAGKNLVMLNKFINGSWVVEGFINRASIVVSLGRGALEAMACNRPVIIWDWRDYMGNCGDGFVDPFNVDEISRTNFSGRAYRQEMDRGNLYDLLELASEKAHLVDGGHCYRHWVLQHANIEIQAKKYLEL